MGNMVAPNTWAALIKYLGNELTESRYIDYLDRIYRNSNPDYQHIILDVVAKSPIRRDNDEYGTHRWHEPRLQVEATGIEGYVVYNTAGNPIKFKTQDWFYHAKLRTTIWGEEYTKNKVAAIIRAYQEDDLDDLWAAQNQPMNTGNLDALTPVVTRIQSWEAKVQEIYDKFQELVTEYGDAQARIMMGRSPEYPNHLKAVMFNAVQEGTTRFFTGESGVRSLLKLVLSDLPKTIPTKEQV